MGGLNIEVSNLVLKSLAKFHAGSLALLAKNPEIMDGLVDNLWMDEEDENLPKMLNSLLATLTETVSEWEDFPREYQQKLKNLEGNIVAKVRDALKFDENKINVLQHGDCWINNMMFRKQGEDITG